MTLALLLTAVTGAWAQSSLNVVEIEVPADWATDESKVTAAELPGFKASTLAEAQAWTGAPAEGLAVLIYAFDGENGSYVSFENGVQNDEAQSKFQKNIVFTQNSDYKFYYTAEAPITVEWNSSTKTGTFTMPAFDVEIDPIYAPAAQWAKVEKVDQLPTAIEGIFAGTTDAIVKAGTVAMMGETENPQGIVMYALTSINQATAPALDAFSATVPTAENIADEGADVLVWYYIQGANTPDGQEATAENTFNDSEICETPIKVTVLPNKYDIHFNAANDNTIEAGKATVKVGETAATVTEGKLEGVKMGSEVKVKANTGYKFRKVEVKKKEALLTLSVCGQTIYYAEGETWAEAIQNHPTENKGWELSDGDVNHENLGFLLQNGDFVHGTAKIDPNASYSNTGT